jgi:hypothetical protein
VSVRLRKRTRCHTCMATCQVVPMELMVRNLNGAHGAWLWWQIALCPPCQTALRGQLGTPQLQELEAPDLDLDGPVAAFVTSSM